MLNKWLPFLIGLVLTLSLMWPLVAAPYFSHHDDVQTIRLLEMHKCFIDGQIPCRWVPDLGGQYGYPLFNYYAPLPYYAGELFYFLTGSFLIAAKFMFAFSFIGSYVFMYLLGRKLWGDWGGTLSGVFYSFAPYHALDLYVRGAMGEMWGLLWYPAILWALLRLHQQVRLKNVALFALFLGFLLTSHNLSTMLIAPVVGLFIVILLRFNATKKLWFYLPIGLILGLMISAFYWLPAYVEKPLAHIDSTIGGYFGYTEHFKGVRKVILERSWGHGGSFRDIPGGPKDDMSYQVGWIHLGFWILAGILLFRKKTEEYRFAKWIFGLSSLVVAGSVFMIHPMSEPVWKLIDPLKYLQFPWRFLSLVIFFISLGIGSLAKTLPQRVYYFVIGAAIVAVVALNFNYFSPEKFIQTTDAEIFSGENWTKLINRSIFDYLPIYAEAPPADLASSRYDVLAGQVEITNYQQGTNWILFNAEASEHSIVRLSQYYFPNWRIFIDGHQTPIDYSNSLGLMTIIVGVGTHEVYAELADTLIRTIANLLSVLGFGLLALIGLAQLRILKKPMIYMLRALYK